MKRQPNKLAAVWLLGGLVTLSSGCTSGGGPFLGVFAVPIPISPYLQKKAEDKAWEHERYDRVPIMGPVTSGGPPVALDPPSDDEVVRVMQRSHPVQGGVPFFHEVNHDNIRVVKELIADYVDPPRVYPLIGPAQLHHAHYKCTVYFTETTHVGWPVPHTIRDEDSQEVVYIDHNHLHMVGNVDTGATANF